MEGPPAAWAEDRPGNAARLVREAYLMRAPADEGASVGRLPKGTILQLLGERRNGFAMVSVELESGQLIEGWVRTDALNRRAREGEDTEETTKTKVRVEMEEDDEEEAKPTPRSRAKKIMVPKDEGLLIKRDYSFFYGLKLSGNYTMMKAADTEIAYSGMGFAAGAHIGFFIDRNVPLALEIGYSALSGAGDDGNVLDFGFFDIGGNVSYLIDRIEVMGTVYYSYGLSLSDIPKEIKLITSADLSSLYAGGGLGYRIMMGEVSEFIIRARYAIGFTQAPIFFQIFSLFAVLEFSG